MRFLFLLAVLCLLAGAAAADNSNENGQNKVIVELRQPKADDDNDSGYFELEFTGGGSDYEEYGYGSNLRKGAGKLLSKFKSGVGKSNNRWHFVLQPAFSYVYPGVWWDMYGFSFDLGARKGIHQITGNYTYCESGGGDVMGGGITYENYRLSLLNIMTLVFGVNAGFYYQSWEFSDEIYRWNGYYYAYDYTEYDHDSEFYLGGPLLKFELGYKAVHAFFRSMLWIGSDVAYKQDIGLNLTF